MFLTGERPAGDGTAGIFRIQIQSPAEKNMTEIEGELNGFWNNKLSEI